MTFHVGQTVRFGRRNGEQSLGKVVKVNTKSIKVELLEARGVYKAHRVGGLWRVHPSLCSPCDGKAATPAPKRDEVEILGDITRIYGALSPENLHCDGEISRTAAMRKYRRLQRELRALFTELGREVSEGESYAFLCESRGW